MFTALISEWSGPEALDRVVMLCSYSCSTTSPRDMHCNCILLGVGGTPVMDYKYM